MPLPMVPAPTTATTLIVRFPLLAKNDSRALEARAQRRRQKPEGRDGDRQLADIPDDERQRPERRGGPNRSGENRELRQTTQVDQDEPREGAGGDPHRALPVPHDPARGRARQG